MRLLLPVLILEAAASTPPAVHVQKTVLLAVLCSATTPAVHEVGQGLLQPQTGGNSAYIKPQDFVLYFRVIQYSSCASAVCTQWAHSAFAKT